MILNMNQLRAFYLAARSGSITQAAQELMVTPPAICMQVKQFEESVGIRLLVRAGNSLRLTPTGESVLERAEKIFQGLYEMEGFLEDISTGKSGELRIGCPETPARYIMPRLVTEFKKSYPGIKIVLDEGSNAEMVKSIETHQNELAFIRHRPNQSRLKMKILRTEEVVLVAASASRHLPSDETSLSRLTEVPLILTKEGSAIREVVFEYYRKFKFKPSVTIECANVALLKQLVRQDHGVTFLERKAVEREVANRSLKVVRLLEGNPTIDFGIGYRNRRNLSPAAWAFLRLLDRSDILSPQDK
jgi:DNA-binding transcriptional LysR family regulator